MIRSQDQLINLINTSSADVGQRIAANAAIDPLTTATLLQREAQFPGATRELLSSPHYENAVLALNGSTTRAAGMTDNVLDGLDADQYGSTEATRIASIIFGDQGSRQLLEIAADRPDLAEDIYRLIDDPDTGELFAAALGSTNREWADDLIFGATEAATPAQRYEFFQEVTTQGNTGLPQWLVDVRAGRQFNTDRNLDYVNLFGNGRDGGEYLSELYLLNKPPATGYVRLDGYVPADVWLDEFEDGAIISRKYTQYATRADPIAAGRADITELRNKYGSGSTIADVPSTPDGLANGQIEGTLILEIPPQTAPLDQAILDWAEESTDPVTNRLLERVVIRDTNGLIYNPVSE